MMKVLLFLLGAAAGAGGAVAWLSSEPTPGTVSPPTAGNNPLEPRLRSLEERFRAAQTEGERAGTYTEEHLRRKLDAYRKGASSGTAL
jgi:hypothetical protein